MKRRACWTLWHIATAIYAIGVWMEDAGDRLYARGARWEGVDWDARMIQHAERPLDYPDERRTW